MDVATLHAFEEDRALVWGWYEWRRMKAMQARPNAGHLAITALQKKLKHLSLITQNTDYADKCSTCAAIECHRLAVPGT